MKFIFAGICLCAVTMFANPSYAQAPLECPQNYTCKASADGQVRGHQQMHGPLKPFGNGPKPPSTYIERAPLPEQQNWSALATARDVQFYRLSANTLETYILGFGHAMNFPSQEEAIEAALQMCEGDQLPGCAVRTVFSGRCFAIAFDQQNNQAFGLSVNTEEADARAWAIQLCRQANNGQACYIAHAYCN